MICTTWNVRGMNDPIKIKEIGKFLNSYKIDVYALLKNRVRAHNSSKVQGKIGKYWYSVSNYNYSPRGRI